MTSVETNVCELVTKSQIVLCGKVYPLGGSHGLQEHSCRLPIWIYFVSGAILVGRSRDRFPVVSQGIFFRGTPDRTMCPEVDSASESEYQGFLLG